MADLGFDYTDDGHDYAVDDAPFSTMEQTTEVSLHVTETHTEASPITATTTTTTATPPSQSIDKDSTDNDTRLEVELPEMGHMEFGTKDLDPDDAVLNETNPDEYLHDFEDEAMDEDVETEIVLDENMSPMERLQSLNKSDVMIHRLLIAKELPDTIQEISLSDAVHAVLPIVLKIGSDPDDTVRETLSSELDKIIMYYYQHAPPLLDSSPNSVSTLDTRVASTSVGPSVSEKQTASAEHKTTQNQEQNAKEMEVDQGKNDNAPEQKTPQEAAVETASKAVPEAVQETGLEVSVDAESQSKTMEAAISTPLPASPSSSPKGQNSTDTKVVSNAGDELHIPKHAFAPLLIDFLLDQNSTLASLGQQCIVSVASELVSAEGTTDEALFTQLLDVEIFEGVVMGLMAIVDGRRQRSFDLENGDGSGEQLADRDDPSHFGNHSTSDDVNQGEINLAKMMCLSLISALAGVLGPQRCTEHCLPIVERMANDQMFYVRKEAAAAVGSLATVVDTQVALDRLVPLYLAFSRDTIWHVRRSCVLALPLLCGVLPEDIKTHIAVEGVKMFRNDASRNVRNTLSEIIGELIARFLPEDWEMTGKPGKVPEPLLDFFLSLGPTASNNQMYKLDTDRAIICAYNFPAVVLTAGASYWDSHLKETYLSLTKDYQIKVRRTFAYSLHEIARIIGPERTERDLVQIFALYLMDLDDVKQGVLEHLTEFLGALATSSRNEYIPILAEVWDGVMTNWRLRDILAGQLRDIAFLFDATRVVEHILPLAIRACQDDFAAVRETGVEAFPVILEMVKQAVDADGETLSQFDDDDPDNVDSRRNYALALLNHVMERLDEFVQSDAYRNRLIFVQICRSLLDMGIDAADFASFFLSRLAPLAHDPVVNVRIATSRTIRAIVKNDEYLRELNELVLPDPNGDNESHPGQVLEQTLYLLAMDKDIDVRSFVIDLVDPKRLAEREEEYCALVRQQEESRMIPCEVDSMQDTDSVLSTSSHGANDELPIQAQYESEPATDPETQTTLPTTAHREVDGMRDTDIEMSGSSQGANNVLLTQTQHGFEPAGNPETQTSLPTEEEKAVQRDVDILTDDFIKFSIKQAEEEDDDEDDDEDTKDKWDEVPTKADKPSVGPLPAKAELPTLISHQAADDKEQEEYVYLSASMVQQEDVSATHVADGTR